MMAGSSYQPPPPMNSVAVISPHFCVGYPVDLTISRKLMTLQEGTFGVTDINGNIMFKIKGKVFSLHDRRVLLDAAGNPIITFQQKVMFFFWSCLWILGVINFLGYFFCCDFSWSLYIEDGRPSEARVQIPKIWYLVWESLRFCNLRRS